MTADQKIKSSYKQVECGFYQHLQPAVTQKGMEAGWKYTQSSGLSVGGINYSQITTLDDLLAKGLIELTLLVSRGYAVWN